MTIRAQNNAAAAGVSVRFVAAGFGNLTQALNAQSLLTPPFDALLCLGNSLPHLLTPADLAAALSDFAACLRPGGLLLIQNRNFDAILDQGERWMEPQSRREGNTEWAFVRFYDFEPDGALTFNLVTLRREHEHENGIGNAESWQQRVLSTRLRPYRQRELEAGLRAAGFAKMTWWGNLQGAPFDPLHSPNLVVVAHQKLEPDTD
jgi:SAM-dependent methyltransferase